VLSEIEIGPVSLKTFGMLFALAFLAIGLLLARRLRELGKPVDWAYEIAFAALGGGLVGARLYWVVENWDMAADNLLASLFGGSGLVWYGGALGGALAVLAWARWRGMLGLGLLDLCAPGLALGYAVGRVGCQVSGDGDYGQAWDGPWAMAYPNGEVPIDEPVHPTPIYESLAMGLIALALWRLRDRLRPGVLFALYLAAAGIERFAVEFVRRNDQVLAGLTAAQLESLVLVAAGIAWLTVARARGGWAVSAQDAPAAAAGR
jgi:phosphatidylglycerol:prolipoprotein diacylglycerol transferase